MRLASFAIKNYKIIDDTGAVKVDPLVTALVGKNESGKSAVMRAMWKSKNVADVDFDKLYDYPRDRYSRERTGTQEVTKLEFALTAEEQGAVKKALPEGTPAGPTTATLTTFYEGKDKTKAQITCDWDLTGSPTGRKAVVAMEAIMREVTSAGDAEALRAVNEAQGKKIPLDGWVWEPQTVVAMDALEAAVIDRKSVV